MLELDHTIRIAYCWVVSCLYLIGTIAWELWPAVPISIVLAAFFTAALESEVRYVNELRRQTEDELVSY